MSLYRCVLEVFVDVEADTEEKAGVAAMEELNEQYKSGRGGIICWEIVVHEVNRKPSP